MAPSEIAWHKRIESMLSADIAVAEKILSEHGLTSADALRAVKLVTPLGFGIQLQPKAPRALNDPTNPCFYALRLLLLAKHLQVADPKSAQYGRRWGQIALGLKFPDIAKSMQGWWLGSHRGVGGAKANDLTQTLQQILREKPDADRKYVLDYLQSEPAADEFSNTENPTIHITGVHVDEVAGTLTYEDRTRKVIKIKILSLDRKIRDLRRG
jgi:hypothetical protein